MDRNKSELHCSSLQSQPRRDIARVLVTGGTGYIGGRLIPELLGRGYAVRVMVRAASPEHQERWPEAEIMVGDALRPESLRETLRGVHTAYYLIHSLLLGPAKFADADIESAVNFRDAAAAEGVQRIIYLGGLGDVQNHLHLSRHLESRMRVAQALSAGPVPTTILRAAVIIGSGSASYEILKHLVSNMPVILIPYWARSRCQPISSPDVIRYLVGVLEESETVGKSYDIGGLDVLTYKQMMRTLATLLSKKRLFVPFPFASIRLYSYIGSLLTPVPAPITVCLMEGLKNDVICENTDIRAVVPFRPQTYKEAILSAMSREEQDRVRTRWSDAYPPAHELAIKLREMNGQISYTSSYFLDTTKPAAALFREICSVGGRRGWFHSNILWRLRGIVDRLLIGVGASRGRRSESSLRINDVIDFWRVEDLCKNARLLLRAEMKLPGLAWLEFRITPVADQNRLSVHAYYETKTAFGKLYWYMFLPFHHFIFNDLIRQIERRSSAEPKT